MKENLTDIPRQAKTCEFPCSEDLGDIQCAKGISPLILEYLGDEHCRPGYSFGPYVRESYVIHFVRSGEGILKKHEKEWRICAGEAFLVYPGEEVTYAADKENPWNYTWVGFHGFRAENILLHAGFSRENPVVTIRDMDRLLAVLKNLMAALDLTFSGELARTGGIYLLMSLLTENHEHEDADISTHEEESSDYRYVQRAAELITTNYRNHLKVEEIAKSIGISRNYLSSVFKRVMGSSPQQFLINYRLEVAASLLLKTANPVNVVALEVGYSDPLSFSKAFHRKYGISPTLYRKQKREAQGFDIQQDA